jgi:hypothetical protein
MDDRISLSWMLPSLIFAFSPVERQRVTCFLFSVCYVERVGAWLSLVERTVRDREVGGSNPLAPTKLLPLDE